MMTGNEIWNMMGNYGSSYLPGMWSNLGVWRLAILIPFLVVVLGLWIYTSLVYLNIAKKLKYKNLWLAWIPFARSAMILQLGDFDWRWVFLLAPVVLLPLIYLNWIVGVALMVLAAGGAIAFEVLCYISHWRFFEKRGYYGWLALTPLAGIFLWYFSFLAGIGFLIILGFVAWKDGTMVKKAKPASVPRPRKSSGRKKK